MRFERTAKIAYKFELCIVKARSRKENKGLLGMLLTQNIHYKAFYQKYRLALIRRIHTNHY
ncbi:hypothetical protein ZONE111904_07730 [Zobellia nedashkovskayae]